MCSRHKGAIALIGIALLLALLSNAWALTATGARGFTSTYSNTSFTAWMVVTLAPPPPSMRCHASSVVSGGWPWASVGGQIQWTPGGQWFNLLPCTTVNGAFAIRVNSRSSVSLTDPPDPNAPVQVVDDTCACDSNVPLGGRVWTTGPDDPSIDWPPPRLHSDFVKVWPDTSSSGPFEYVILFDTTGVTTVTNHPYASGIVFVRAFAWMEPTPDLPVLPGMSVSIDPTGAELPPKCGIARSVNFCTAPPGEVCELEFEVWNLCPAPAVFDVWAQDSDGWPLVVSDPQPTIPPQSFVMISVSLTVPESPGLHTNMVTLHVEDPSNPLPAEWEAAFAQVDTTATGAGEPVAPSLWLGQCNPNPFNPWTWIPYEVPVLSRVTIEVFDTQGRLVNTLLDEMMPPGRRAVVWYGTNANGAPVASGVYFCRMRVPGRESLVRKMVLLK